MTASIKNVKTKSYVTAEDYVELQEIKQKTKKNNREPARKHLEAKNKIRGEKTES